MKSNNKQHKKRVFLVQEILTNYRVPVFRRLSNLDGIDLTIFFSYLSKLKKKEGFREVENINGFRYKVVPHISIGQRVFLPTIVWHIVKEHPDVVISKIMGGSCSYLFVCKLLRIPFIWWTGGIPYQGPLEETPSRQSILRRMIPNFHPRRRIAFMSDATIIYSDHAKQHLASLGKEPKSIFVAYNSMDTDTLLEYRQRIEGDQTVVERIRNAHNLAEKKIILFVGRLTVSHRVDLLLNAYLLVKRQLDNVALLIVGEGPELDNLRRLEEKLGLTSVFFLGSIYDDWELSKWFYLTDVYVTPGVASLTVKFAMAFSKPVVSVAYGLEVHSIEHGRNGFITTPGDPEDLSKKIIKVLSNDELRISMGHEALKTVPDKVNIHTMIKGFEDAIQYVTTKGR